MAQQTAVQWLLSELQIRLLKIKSEPDGIVRETMINSFLIDAEQAEAMEKEQIMKAINEVSENNVKYANMIIASWSQIEGELFMHNTKLSEQYYNETYNK